MTEKQATDAAADSPVAMDTLLDDLTEPQRQAVSTTEGPVLVMAAAGSGKTRVLTRRVAYLIQRMGIPPWQILSITFTNKAAGEMRDRVAEMVTERQARALTIGTFHALCARLLRTYAEDAGLQSDFTIYDAADQKRAMKQAMKNQDVDPKNFTPQSVLGKISNAKNQLLDADDFQAQAGDFYHRIVARCYTGYDQILKKANALDFDDLLMRTAFLLRDEERVRAELQDRYQYLLIDEYQDTNHAQFVIAHTIAAEHQNIFVVGDPDQSIYGWRGANIRNILEFEAHFPKATVIELGQNYRSTPQILQAADALIRHNKQRRHKPLFTENAEGEPIHLVQAADEEHEADVVIDWFRQRHADGVPWSRMAVFYRMNALSRTMEDRCRQHSIPHQIARGTAFYQRAEIKDALAYLRVLANPRDEVNLLRIINTPTRGIGNTTIQHLQAHATATGKDLWDIIQTPSQANALNSRAANAVKRFADLVNGWFKKMDEAETQLAYVPGARDVVEMVLRDTNLEEHHRKQDEEKAANIAELITDAAKFDETYPEEEPEDGVEPTLRQKLNAYLERVSLIADTDAVTDSEGAVTLMTLHAAKGLEFDCVAMIGVEDGLLPHSRSREDDSELEEERRLCFVGITRARKALHLSHARYRTQRGISERTMPSPFLKELPKDVLETTDLSDAPMKWDDPLDDADDGFGEDEFGGGSFGGEAPFGLRRGMKVRHPQFGIGKITQISGAGRNSRVKVQFDEVGVKTLILEYARLEILP